MLRVLDLYYKVKIFQLETCTSRTRLVLQSCDFSARAGNLYFTLTQQANWNQNTILRDPAIGQGLDLNKGPFEEQVRTPKRLKVLKPHQGQERLSPLDQGEKGSYEMHSRNGCFSKWTPLGCFPFAPCLEPTRRGTLRSYNAEKPFHTQENWPHFTTKARASSRLWGNNPGVWLDPRKQTQNHGAPRWKRDKQGLQIQ